MVTERRFRTGVFGDRTTKKDPITTVKRRHGFSERAGIDILLNRGEVEREGVRHQLQQGVSNLVRGTGEIVAEFGQGVFESARGIDPFTGEKGPSLGEIRGDKEAFRGLREFIEGPDAPEPGAPSGGEVEDALKVVEESAADIEAIQVVRDRTLDPLSQEQLDLYIEQKQLELVANTEALRAAQIRTRTQDAIFEFQAQALGLDPDVADLSEAIDADGGGIGVQTQEAIMAAINDPNLTDGQKQETIDLLTDRFKFGGAVVAEVETLIENEQRLTAIQEDPNAEGFVDELRYLTPFYANANINDPELRFNMNLTTDFDKQFPSFDAGGDLELGRALGVLFQLAEVNELDSSHPDFALVLNAMNEGVSGGPNAQRLMDGLMDAVESATNTERSLNSSLDAKKLTPGGEPLMFALQRTALNSGMYSEQAAHFYANAEGLHAIIREVSNGAASKEGPGTIRGIGGLTEDVYRIYMIGEDGPNDDGMWNPDRGMEWELLALARWVADSFQGDVIAAMNYYYRTGDWGGTSAIPGMSAPRVTEAP